MILYMSISENVCKGVNLMNRKEIYASVEIADHEIRLIVGEFYDTRFNILRVERAGTTGIEKKKIIDEQMCIRDRL